MKRPLIHNPRIIRILPKQNTPRQRHDRQRLLRTVQDPTPIPSHSCSGRPVGRDERELGAALLTVGLEDAKRRGRAVPALLLDRRRPVVVLAELLAVRVRRGLDVLDVGDRDEALEVGDALDHAARRRVVARDQRRRARPLFRVRRRPVLVDQRRSLRSGLAFGWGGVVSEK